MQSPTSQYQSDPFNQQTPGYQQYPAPGSAWSQPAPRSNKRKPLILIASAAAVLILAFAALWIFTDILPFGSGSEPSASGRSANASVNALSGTVTVGGSSISEGDTISPDDIVSTGARSWASLEFSDGQIVYMEENTRIEVLQIAEAGADGERLTILNLTSGKIWVDISQRLGANEGFRIQSPSTVLDLSETLLYFEVDGNETTVCVLSGDTNVSAMDGVSGGLDPHRLRDGLAARITMRGGAITDWWQGPYIMNDIAPFAYDAGPGPGGLFERLRDDMADLVWREEIISFGRPRTSILSNYTARYTNSCGSVAVDLTVSFPSGGDMHFRPNSHAAYSTFFPDGGDLLSLSLFVTNDGTLPYNITLTAEHFRDGRLDVYQGTLNGSHVEFNRVQQESGINMEVPLRLSGISRWMWFSDNINAGMSYADQYTLVISTADANTLLQTGVLPGYENAPFVDAVIETLTYAYNETVLVSPGGGTVPLQKPVPGAVLSFGRPGTSTVIAHLYANTGPYSVGSVFTGLDFFFPDGANTYRLSEVLRGTNFPSTPDMLGNITLYVTDGGLASFNYAVHDAGPYTSFHRDVYQGVLVGDNVEYRLLEANEGRNVTVSNLSGFIRIFRYAAFGNEFLSGSSAILIISTADANVFLETGVLPGFEDLPRTFLDSLRDELYYTYKVYAPTHG